MRNTAAEIETGAEVAEDLAPEVEVGVVGGFGMGGVVVGVELVRGYVPPQNAGEDYEEDGGEVEEDGLEGAAFNCSVVLGVGSGWTFGAEEWRGDRWVAS